MTFTEFYSIFLKHPSPAAHYQQHQNVPNPQTWHLQFDPLRESSRTRGHRGKIIPHYRSCIRCRNLSAISCCGSIGPLKFIKVGPKTTPKFPAVIILSLEYFATLLSIIVSRSGHKINYIYLGLFCINAISPKYYPFFNVQTTVDS